MTISHEQRRRQVGHRIHVGYSEVRFASHASFKGLHPGFVANTRLTKGVDLLDVGVSKR